MRQNEQGQNEWNVNRIRELEEAVEEIWYSIDKEKYIYFLSLYVQYIYIYILKIYTVYVRGVSEKEQKMREAKSNKKSNINHH